MIDSLNMGRKSGDDFPSAVKIYFCLKLKNYDSALWYVNKLIENNEMAYKINAQYFTENEMQKMREARRVRDASIYKLAEFIQSGDEASIQKELEDNEVSAMNFFAKKRKK